MPRAPEVLRELYHLTTSFEPDALPLARPMRGRAALAMPDTSITCYGTDPSCPTLELTRLLLPLPGGETVVATRLTETYNPDGTLLWTASLHAPESGERGHVVLTFVVGEVIATAKLGPRWFAIQPDGYGNHFVQEYATSPRLSGKARDDVEAVRPDAGQDTYGGDEHDGDWGDTGAQPVGSWPPSGEDPYAYFELTESALAETFTLAPGTSLECTSVPIDVLVAYSPDVLVDLGTHAGIIGFSNIRIWQANKLLSNSQLGGPLKAGSTACFSTGQQRRHFYRLVGVEPLDRYERDPDGTLRVDGNGDPIDILNPSNPNCTGKDFRVHARLGEVASLTDTTWSTVEMRNYYAADVVALAVNGNANCNGIGWAPIPANISPSTHNLGYLTFMTGPRATSQWTMPHEIGHLLGIGHIDAGVAGGFAETEAQNPRPFPAAPWAGSFSGFRTMMRNGNGVGCRLPVYSSEEWYWFANLLDDPDDPCVGQWDDRYSDQNVTLPNEFRFQIDMSSTDPDNSDANAREYLNEPANPTYPVFTPLQILAGYREPPASTSPIYAAAVISQADSPSDLALFATTGSVLLSWAPPQWPNLYAPAPDEPDYYLLEVWQGDITRTAHSHLGTLLFEADDYEAVHAGLFTVDLGNVPGLDRSRAVFTRLWSQVAQDHWMKSDQLFNTGQLLSCSDHHSALSHADYDDLSCLVSTGSGTPGCRLQSGGVACELEAAGGTTSTELFAVDFDGSADALDPFDLTLLGRVENGTEFCCVYDSALVTAPELEVIGSSRGDVVSFRLEPGIELPWATSYVSLDSGNDDFLGSYVTDVEVHGGPGRDLLRPRGGTNYAYGEGGADFFIDGPGEDHLYGASGSDVLISNDGTSGDELFGGTGKDYLCTDDGGDSLVANDFPTYTTDQLYVSSTATADPCTGSSVASSSGARCGRIPAWNGTYNCPSTGLPWADLPSLSCNYNLNFVPSPCSGYITP